MALDILTGTIRGDSVAVLVADGHAFGPVFDDAADAIGFLRWYYEAAPGDPLPWGLERDIVCKVRGWRKVRHLPECPREGCVARVEPSHKVCETCEGDDELEAEQAAKGAA